LIRIVLRRRPKDSPYNVSLDSVFGRRPRAGRRLNSAQEVMEFLNWLNDVDPQHLWVDIGGEVAVTLDHILECGFFGPVNTAAVSRKKEDSIEMS